MEGREAFYSPMVDLSLSVSLHLWTFNFTCVTQSSPSPIISFPLCETKWPDKTRAVYFPQIRKALIKLQEMRLWFNTSSWGQMLLRREYPAVFLNISFSFLPAGSKRGFFSHIHYENLAKLLEAKFTKVLGHQRLGPLGVFISQTCSHWACSNSSVLVQASLPHHQFPQRFQTHRFLSSKL